jgi:hypothetical protein
MATIHITDIQRLLVDRGEADALPYASGSYFLEIRFDDPNYSPGGVVDTELRNQTITANCPYGSVTIQFDANGELRSIDLS